MRKLKSMLFTAGIAAVLAVGVGATVTTSNRDAIRADAAGTEQTSTIIVSDYATANGWQNSTHYDLVDSDLKYQSWNSKSNAVDKNSGKYFSSGNNWRFYKSSKLRISVPDIYKLVKTTLTFTNSNGGALRYGGTVYTSGKTINLSGNEAILDIVKHNNSSKNNEQVKITKLETVYDFVSTVPPTSVDFNPTNKDLLIGEEKTLSASVLPADSAQAILWSIQSQSPNVEGRNVATLTDAGVLTGENVGTVVVRAASKIDSSKFADVTFTVKENEFEKLTYTGDIATQIATKPFNPDGLIFKGTRKSGLVEEVNISDLTYSKDPLVAGANNKIKFTITGTNISCEVGPFDVIEYKANVYTPVNATSELKTGDKVVFTAYDKVNKVMKVGKRQLDSTQDKMDTTAVAYESGDLTITSENTTFVEMSVTVNESSFTLKDEVTNANINSGSNGKGIYSNDDSATNFEIKNGKMYKVGLADRVLLYQVYGKGFKMYSTSNDDPSKTDYYQAKVFKKVSGNYEESTDRMIKDWGAYRLHIGDADFDGSISTGEVNCLDLYKFAKSSLNNLERKHSGIMAEVSGENYAEIKARYEAWARANGDAYPYDGKEFIQQTNIIVNIDNTIMITCIVVISAISITAISVLMIARRKKATR